MKMNTKVWIFILYLINDWRDYCRNRKYVAGVQMRVFIKNDNHKKETNLSEWANKFSCHLKNTPIDKSKLGVIKGEIRIGIKQPKVIPYAQK